MIDDKSATEPSASELATEAKTIVQPAEVEVVRQQELFGEWIKTNSQGVTFKKDTPFEVWESYTLGILEFGRRSMRIAGQCLLFGEKAYGERYAQVIDAMRYNPKSLQNASWVVSRIEHWHDKLSFAHHEVVAALPPKPQDEMLTKAETDGLTVSKFKGIVREKYPPKKPKKVTQTGKPTKITAGFTTDEDAVDAANKVIAYLEALDLKHLNKAQLATWSPSLITFRNIARRAGILK